jgi:hypothetical protein
MQMLMWNRPNSISWSLNKCCSDTRRQHHCLCEYHAKVKLILEAITWLPNFTGKPVKMIVCDVTKEDCMFQKCDLKLFAKVVKDVLNKPGSSERMISYEQWGKQEGERLNPLKAAPRIRRWILFILSGWDVLYLTTKYTKYQRNLTSGNTLYGMISYEISGW